MLYKVKDIAAVVGVSVRTLHHYDKMGLLCPECISDKGYRLYGDENLARLQQILFFKEIGFSLTEIKTLLDSPGFDRKRALDAHKALLLKKQERLADIILTVEKTIQALERGEKMKQKEMFKGFDMQEIEAHKAKYAEEVRQKWGKTDAYQESARRTAKYTPNDWAGIQANSADIYQQIIANMANGPATQQVQDGVAALRQSITDHFYTCTPEIFRGLGQMYVSDERFKAFYENIKLGLAEFLSEAIQIYCDNLDKSSS